MILFSPACCLLQAFNAHSFCPLLGSEGNLVLHYLFVFFCLINILFIVIVLVYLISMRNYFFILWQLILLTEFMRRYGPNTLVVVQPGSMLSYASICL